MRLHQRVCVPVLLTSAIFVLAACDNPPKGRTSGRIDPATSTEGEAASHKVLPASLMEFSDQVAQRLAQDLMEIPSIRDNPSRVTVILGDINNRTDVISSSEFELVRARIRNNLLQSRFVKDKIKFVENRARMSRLREREQVGGADAQAGEPATYDPTSTYALNGDFYRIARPETSQYYMEFQLSHFATNEIVFSDRYDAKKVWVND